MAGAAKKDRIPSWGLTFALLSWLIYRLTYPSNSQLQPLLGYIWATSFIESYFVHLFMFLLLSGILLRVVQIPLNVLKNSGQVSGVLNHSQLGPSLALYLLCL